ncbi:hypothetical protein FVF58_14145 [Paraburkholderia panacisoli]|uniref:Uncharacterized protein n=1 Tax=Paraburkholderia panacisoli TaxID=2603818 RepID=A0A5B0H9D0_9BURK|nr:hypothetical protein [Paraburkholderia panacisoli]KAA1011634.1 hypothetical protein FVF58_14145 [Paraburkholderia panacisoli]
MGIRVMAAALAVWCVSEAAMAAGYAEVWNPPEASGHVAKHATKKPGAGVKAGSKAASKHGANAGHGAPRMAAAGAGHGSKLAAHGGVKKVAAKGGATRGAKAPATANKPKAKAAVMAQTGKPHAQLVRSKPGQGKVVHADLAQSRAAHSHVTKVAAKPATVRSANASAMSANVSAGSADAATNPATASSGSLPPIIH